MKIEGQRQQGEWTKKYRIFLWIVLVLLLILTGCFYYGMRRRSEIPREGTLVYSEEFYERET